MTAYAFTKSTRGDLLHIWSYTHEKWGEAQADRYQDELHDCCARIAAGTIRAKPVPAINGVNSHHCRHHYLFFVEQREIIVFIAVFHERMDLIERLRDRL